MMGIVLAALILTLLERVVLLWNQNSKQYSLLALKLRRQDYRRNRLLYPIYVPNLIQRPI